MSKDLNYYMNLPYKTQVVEIPEDEGGGVVLFHPELGKNSANAWGENYEEARSTLLKIKKGIFERCLRENLVIPEPKELKEYSGKLLLRIPKLLHEAISNMAQEDGTSINACIVQLITKAITTTNIEEAIYKRMDSYEKSFRKAIENQSEQRLFRSIAGDNKLSKLKACPKWAEEKIESERAC